MAYNVNELRKRIRANEKAEAAKKAADRQQLAEAQARLDAELEQQELQAVKEAKAKGVSEPPPPRFTPQQEQILKENPLLACHHLAKFMGVTRQSILRYRLVGFLPRGIFVQGVGYFWPAKTIRQWVLDDYKWGNTRRAKVAMRHARANHYDMNEYIAPQPADEWTERVEATEELAQSLDEFAKALDRWDLQVMLASCEDDPVIPHVPPRTERMLWICKRLEELRKQGAKEEQKRKRRQKRKPKE